MHTNRDDRGFGERDADDPGSGKHAFQLQRWQRNDLAESAAAPTKPEIIRRAKARPARQTESRSPRESCRAEERSERGFLWRWRHRNATGEKESHFEYEYPTSELKLPAANRFRLLCAFPYINFPGLGPALNLAF